MIILLRNQPYTLQTFILKNPLLDAILNRITKPAILVKVERSAYNLVSYNNAFKDISGSKNFEFYGKNVTEIFAISKNDEIGALVINDIFNKTFATNKTMKLVAAFFDVHGTLEADKNRWEMEVEPFKSTGVITDYIFCSFTKYASNFADSKEYKIFKQQDNPVANVAPGISEQNFTSNKNLFALISNLEKRIANNIKATANSLEKASYMLKDAPVAIGVLTGEELIIETANDKILEVWGRGKDASVIGKPLRFVLPEIRSQKYLEILHEVFVTGKSYYGNESKVVLVRNGILEDVYFSFIYHPILDSENNTTHIMIVATEVTELVNLRTELAQSRGIVKLAADMFGLATFSVDIPAKLIKLSYNASVLLGFTQATEIDFNTAKMLLLPTHLPTVQQQLMNAINGGATFEINCLVKPPNMTLEKMLKIAGNIYYGNEKIATSITGIIADTSKN